MKVLVEKIFGKEAAEDEDIVRLYEETNRLVMIDLIQYTAGEIIAPSELSDECAESILDDFLNEELNTK